MTSTGATRSPYSAVKIAAPSTLEAKATTQNRSMFEKLLL